jgi:anaerobic sulfite reductase subunit B
MILEPKPQKIVLMRRMTEDTFFMRIKSNMNPMPGQFFQVSVLGIGECPLASCSFNKNYLDTLVRNVGSVTNALSKLKKGDNVFIRGPYGKGYPVKKVKKRNLLVIAGGTGVASVTPLIEYVEKHRKDFLDVSIFLGFRSAEHILFNDKIKKWKKKFDLKLCLDKAPSELKRKLGCEIGLLPEIIAKHKIKLKKTAAFICGPQIMMKYTIDKLKKAGFKEKQIYISLERRMECGFGACGRCMIRNFYVCKDGPVFRLDKIKNFEDG